MTSTKIRDFWLKHPEFWIAFNQTKADNIIYTTFHNYDYKKETPLGQIIYLDQFLRHFSRVTQVDESYISEARKTAAQLSDAVDTDKTTDLELIWYLMPYKHLNLWHPLFSRINSWLLNQNKLITDHAQLNRFFMDSYKKAYTDATIHPAIMLSNDPDPTYNAEKICDSHPTGYVATQDWLDLELPHDAKQLLLHLPKDTPVTISLSGGVDSMLLAALLKRAKANVIAVHIIYGNRLESDDECNFIKTYCHRLSIPLYLYKITWLQRATSDRAFYETMTRDIRFSVYRALNRPTLLGHIQEDVVENIWTNLARGNNLDNLAKFERNCLEAGVQIVRPWLTIKKELIYKVAQSLSIPYLKNSTPTWSNRGKFRNRFYAETKLQYGDSVDDMLINVSERYKQQSALLNRVLYQRILKSWDPELKTLDVSLAIEVDLDTNSWLILFTELAHSKLNWKKPSYKSCEDFVDRVKRGLKNNQIISLSKTFKLKTLLVAKAILLQF
jgi:tRNA(Ile)-lysidine synthetase-like protein